eukprot:gene10296-8218_t
MNRSLDDDAEEEEEDDVDADADIVPGALHVSKQKHSQAQRVRGINRVFRELVSGLARVVFTIMHR